MRTRWEIGLLDTELGSKEVTTAFLATVAFNFNCADQKLLSVKPLSPLKIPSLTSYSQSQNGRPSKFCPVSAYALPYTCHHATAKLLECSILIWDGMLWSSFVFVPLARYRYINHVFYWLDKLIRNTDYHIGCWFCLVSAGAEVWSWSLTDRIVLAGGFEVFFLRLHQPLFSTTSMFPDFICYVFSSFSRCSCLILWLHWSYDLLITCFLALTLIFPAYEDKCSHCQNFICGSAWLVVRGGGRRVMLLWRRFAGNDTALPGCCWQQDFILSEVVRLILSHVTPFFLHLSFYPNVLHWAAERIVTD